MATSEQSIELRLVLNYSSEDGKKFDLSARADKIQSLIFDALEHERQESKISPAGLSCDYFDLDVVQINRVDGEEQL